MDTTNAAADIIRNKIVNGTPFVSGVCKISPYDARIVYGLSSDTVRWIDLASSAPEALEALTAACQPATFGRNNEDVYDETYRKAGKMDVSDFVSSLDPHTYGIIDSIQKELLKEGQSIRAEMYKLNVYGKDSFFKAHKDTPRGKNMIGSLVVVFPTPHQGGALVLRHSTGEWTFDSGTVLEEGGNGNTPSIAYVAFFSDVEHEVLTVTAGHRVTLTWNLFLLDDGMSTPAQSLALPVNELTKTISLALSDPGFMPKGGTIGFGLNYQYPVTGNLSFFEDILGSLKGSDADLRLALTKAGLDPSVMGLYTVENDHYHSEDLGENLSLLLSSVPDVDGTSEEESTLDQLIEYGGAKVVYDYGTDSPDDFSEKNTRQVYWVAKPKANEGFSTPYVSYGNDASVGYLYAHLVLIADVSPSGERIKK